MLRKSRMLIARASFVTLFNFTPSPMNLNIFHRIAANLVVKVTYRTFVLPSICTCRPTFSSSRVFRFRRTRRKVGTFAYEPANAKTWLGFMGYTTCHSPTSHFHNTAAVICTILTSLSPSFEESLFVGWYINTKYYPWFSSSCFQSFWKGKVHVWWARNSFEREKDWKWWEMNTRWAWNQVGIERKNVETGVVGALNTHCM